MFFVKHLFECMTQIYKYARRPKFWMCSYLRTTETLRRSYTIKSMLLNK